MNCNIISFLLVVILTCSLGAARRFPTYLERCYQHDPNVTLCYKKAVEAIKGHLSQGIPEFFFPPMSPLLLPQISIDNGNNLKALFTNVKIYNLELMGIQDVNFNLNDDQFMITMILPKLRLLTDYALQGKILFLQLNSRGTAEGNFTNVKVELQANFQRYKQGGKEYLKFTTVKIEESVPDAAFKFEGLFKDPVLNEQTNRVVNDNIQVILEELRPAIHKTSAETIIGLLGRMFEKFSLEELFPV